MILRILTVALCALLAMSVQIDKRPTFTESYRSQLQRQFCTSLRPINQTMLWVYQKELSTINKFSIVRFNLKKWLEEGDLKGSLEYETPRFRPEQVFVILVVVTVWFGLRLVLSTKSSTQASSEVVSSLPSSILSYKTLFLGALVIAVFRVGSISFSGLQLTNDMHNSANHFMCDYASLMTNMSNSQEPLDFQDAQALAEKARDTFRKLHKSLMQI